MCGFEKFKKFLCKSRYFRKNFFKNNRKYKEGKFQINSEMMNLIGSSKENFYQLIDLMNYKRENKKLIFFHTKVIKKSKKKQNL